MRSIIILQAGQKNQRTDEGTVSSRIFKKLTSLSFITHTPLEELFVLINHVCL